MKNGSWLPEEVFNGLSDNFFDDFINHVDFPLEDIETANEVEGDWDVGFQNLVPPPMDVLTSLSAEFTCGNTCNGQRVGVQKPVPNVKQSSSSEVSSTVDSSLTDVKVSKLFQSSSPVSVLDIVNGSVSFQNQNRAQRLVTFTVKGIRSKRKRPTTTLKFGSIQSFGIGMTPYESESETYLSSAKKKCKKNKNRPGHSAFQSPEPFNADGTVRRCTHCETTNTPQWREGPSGPKTLCNACGVRYRSGRLLPEYRPASSPTFIPTVHSNSHRRIIEMRKRSGDKLDTSQ